MLVGTLNTGQTGALPTKEDDSCMQSLCKVGRGQYKSCANTGSLNTSAYVLHVMRIDTGQQSALPT